jgi:hypothetical protein
MRSLNRGNKNPLSQVLEHRTERAQPNVRKLLRVNERLNCTPNPRPLLQSSAHLHDAGAVASPGCDELRRQLQAARDELMLGGNRAEIIQRIHRIEAAIAAKGCADD